MVRDPDYYIIKEKCQQLVGRSFEFTLFSGSEMIPLGHCDGFINAVGHILESVTFWTLKEALPRLERGSQQKSPDLRNREYEYEIKSFETNPNFDISGYDAYIHQLAADNGIRRKILQTKYLVFQYKLFGCKIIIKNFWMLNIWNLVGYDGKYPITIQNKRGIWYNIRPSSLSGWADDKRDAKKFIENIIQSIQLCPNKSMHDKHRIIQRMYTQLAAL